MNPLNWFAAHRVKVFPVQPGAKTPAVPRDTSWNEWDDFTRPRPSGSYGVVLGSLLVVDADSPATASWIAQHVPATPFTVLSGPYHDGSAGRGRHHYFRAPDVLTPAFIHRDHLAIEARRIGQYVLGPDSVHPSGCIYEACEWSWRWDDLPMFPVDFAFNDGTGTTSEVGAPYEPPRRMVQGERSHELFRLVRHMKALGASIEETRYTVELYNANRCDPPKSDKWLRAWFPRAWGHRDRPDFGFPAIDAQPDVPMTDFVPYEVDHD
jgi:hypothetical protein